MPDILFHMGWRTPKPEEHYFELNRLLCTGGASAALANIRLELPD